MRKNFFLIDDDRDDQFLFADALAEINKTYQCFFAENGLEAIQKLKSGVVPLPDCIFLDVNMPYMNGGECLAHLRKIDGLKEVPVIMYSTTELEKEKIEMLGKGASYFLTKPYTFKGICDSIRMVISKFLKATPERT